MTFVVLSIADHALPEMFDCSEPALNRFLLQHATENEGRGLSSTHLFCKQVGEDRSAAEVLGYFSLTTAPLDVSQLPSKLTRRYPGYAKDNLTVTLLARLALDKQHQGKGFGGAIIIDAMKTITKGWDYINSVGILIHAKHEKAAEFYEKYGFQRLPENQLHLFMSRKDVRLIVRQMPT